MRQLVSSASTKKTEEKKKPTKGKTRSNCPDVKKKKDGTENGIKAKRSSQTSMIPKLKLHKNEGKVTHKNQESSTPSKISFIRTKHCGDSRESVKKKTNSISECYTKIEDFIHKAWDNSEKTGKKPKLSNPSSAHKMISDTLVFKKETHKKNVLANFNSDIPEVSQVWLAATTDLSDAFKILEGIPSSDLLDANNVETPQGGVKQVKSLTLVKSRNMLEEAKELMLHRRLIRREIEKLVAPKVQKEEEESGKWDGGEEGEREGEGEEGEEDGEEEYICGEEDTFDEVDPKSGIKYKEKNAENTVKSNFELFVLNEDEEECDELKRDSEQLRPARETRSTSTSNATNLLAAEIKKKNETITQLNNKIFELQNSRNETTQRCCQLQGKLAEYQRKIQWSHVLCKQIGKLKDRINGLQQDNKELQSQKSELECKIEKLDAELERALKLNQKLGQNCWTLDGSSGESIIESEVNLERKSINLKKKVETGEKILAEKQSMIEHLKIILEQMKEQEYSAQKQISLFKSKIKQLEKTNPYLL